MYWTLAPDVRILNFDSLATLVSFKASYKVQAEMSLGSGLNAKRSRNSGLVKNVYVHVQGFIMMRMLWILLLDFDAIGTTFRVSVSHLSASLDHISILLFNIAERQRNCYTHKFVHSFIHSFERLGTSKINIK